MLWSLSVWIQLITFDWKLAKNYRYRSVKVYELTDYLQREGHRCVCFRQENNFHCKWTVGGAILARSMHGDLSTYSTPVKSTHMLKKDSECQCADIQWRSPFSGICFWFFIIFFFFKVITTIEVTLSAKLWCKCCIGWHHTHFSSALCHFMQL